MPSADPFQPSVRPRYRDRREAGRALAQELAGLADENPVVVALPRGGVPVGYEVARALGAPLDIGLVRKLGAPTQPELGIGALGEGGKAVLDTEAVRRLGISREDLDTVVEREQRRARAPPPQLPARPPADRRRRTGGRGGRRRARDRSHGRGRGSGAACSRRPSGGPGRARLPGRSGRPAAVGVRWLRLPSFAQAVPRRGSRV